MCHLVLAEVLDAYIGRYGNTLMAGGKRPLLVETAHDYVGRYLTFWSTPAGAQRGETWREQAPEGGWEAYAVEAHLQFTFDDALLVQSVVDYVVEQHHLLGGTLHIEQRVPIGHITGEIGATGSADVVFVGDGWAHVIDAKFGRKLVQARYVVTPETIDFIRNKTVPAVTRPNLQMTMYASGALRKHCRDFDVREVTLTIAQPTLHSFDSTVVPIEELNATCAFLSEQAKATRSNPQFVPSAEACVFCLKSGNCAAETELALSTVLDEVGPDGKAKVRGIDDLTVGDQFALLPFVEQWVKAVKAHVQTQLEDGKQVTRSDGIGYKLVAGRAGARKWVDELEVETYLKKLRLNAQELYSRKLISPAQFDQLLALAESQPDAGHTVLGPRQIAKVRSLMVQAEGKPQIVPTTSSKPALVKASGFEDVPSEVDDFAALFGQ